MTPASKSILALATLLAAGACLPDWDALDPSLGSGGAGQGGAGGAPGGGGPLCTPGEMVACYEGPTGTEGVGICSSGMALCNEDGTELGPCEGQTQPSTEDCATEDDDDCDGLVNEADAGCPCVPNTLVDCYDGPSGTAMTGACAAGQALCLATEMPDVCIGQVLPLHEECTNQADDDCDGEANEDCPLWGLRFGVNGQNDDIAFGLSVAPNGEMVMVGFSAGTLDFGLGALAPLGDNDIFIAKLDAAGNEIWARRDGGALEDEALAVDIDAMGNVIVVGSFRSPLDFGGASSPLTPLGVEDAFVAKFDGNGVAQWAVAFGGASPASTDATLLAVDTDPQGNIVVTGDFIGNIGQGASTEHDGFVATLSPSGTINEVKAFGAGGNDVGTGVVWVGGNVAITGSFDSSINFGGASTQDVSGIDGFVALLDNNLDQQWIDGIGDAGSQFMRNVATDGTTIYAYGEGSGTIDLGMATASASDDDVFVLAYDTGGTVLWGQAYEGINDQHADGLVVDAAGGLWFAVSHESSADYLDGGPPVLSAGSDDWVLVKLNAADGTTLKSVRFGGTSDQDPRALGVDDQNDLYVAGDCEGTVDFGQGPISGNGYEDICLLKLPE